MAFVWQSKKLIANLSKAVKRIATGDLNFRLKDAERKDETGDLAFRFNEINEKLVNYNCNFKKLKNRQWLVDLPRHMKEDSEKICITG